MYKRQGRYGANNNNFSVGSGTGFDTSKVVTSSPVSWAVRRNDINFAFTPHSGSNKSAAMQFDIYYSDADMRSGYFGLAYDANSSGGIDTATERSPAFGIVNYEFAIQFLGDAPDASTFGKPVDRGVSDGDWLRMQMVIDFTANSGNGAARLFFQNLTQEATGFTELTSSPVNLGLISNYDADSTYTAMSNPANWDTMIVYINGSAALDNLVPNAVPVPEPASVVLAVLALLGFGLVRRRR